MRLALKAGREVWPAAGGSAGALSDKGKTRPAGLTATPMAHDDRTSDQFIREVDEELRRDQLKSLWDRFGLFVIAAAVLIVLITAGYRGWIWWQDRQAAEWGDRYVAAVEASESGERDRAEEMLSEIVEKGAGGYPVLARLRLAAVRAEAGQTDAAIELYDNVAADRSVEAVIRDLARLRAALLALNQDELDGAVERAEGLAVSGSPWRHAAREVLGTAAFERGQLEEARERFVAIQQDAESPREARTRATVMIELIDGMTERPGGSPQAQGEGAARVAAEGERSQQ